MATLEIDQIIIYSGTFNKGRRAGQGYKSMQFRLTQEVGNPTYFSIFEDRNSAVFHRFADNCETKANEDGTKTITAAAIQKAVEEGKIEHKWKYFCTCPLLNADGTVWRNPETNKPDYKWDGRYRFLKSEALPLGDAGEKFIRIDKAKNPILDRNGLQIITETHQATYVERYEEEDDAWRSPAGLSATECLEADRQSMYMPFKAMGDMPANTSTSGPAATSDTGQD